MTGIFARLFYRTRGARKSLFCSQLPNSSKRYVNRPQLTTLTLLWKRRLVAWPAPSHYLNQCWDIFNWTFENRLQWNLYRSSYMFIHEIVLNIPSGKWRPFCFDLILIKYQWIHGYSREIVQWETIAPLKIFHTLSNLTDSIMRNS